ncbi:hypothetical protein [Piscibacillus salipiscarius]|uniref:Uncharacterized protein n=1 Tax=Piscibacillus salipiscarius TaxID=299480 RepID=A0ABW5Q7L3_9BACI|nr:hypothetical protein [Piscibacillus salipiscarius]
MNAKTVEWKPKLKTVISFFLITIGLLGLCYVLVYNYSFMPNGYDVISKEHYELTVIKYNWLGQTDEIITKDFKDEPNPRVANYVAKTINGLKLKYFLAFFVITMSAILMFYEVKVKEKKWWKSIFYSGFVVNLLQIIIIAQELDRIQQTLS